MDVVNKKYKMQSNTVSRLSHNHILLSAYLAFVSRQMESGGALLHMHVRMKKSLGKLL